MVTAPVPCGRPESHEQCVTSKRDGCEWHWYRGRRGAMQGFGGFAKAFEAAIDKTLGIDGAQAEAVLGEFLIGLPWPHHGERAVSAAAARSARRRARRCAPAPPGTALRTVRVARARRARTPRAIPPAADGARARQPTPRRRKGPLWPRRSARTRQRSSSRR